MIILVNYILDRALNEAIAADDGDDEVERQNQRKIQCGG